MAASSGVDGHTQEAVEDNRPPNRTTSKPGNIQTGLARFADSC